MNNVPSLETITAARPPQHPSAPVSADVLRDTLTGWAVEELAFWRMHRVSRPRAEQIWQSLNETNPNLFLFQIDSNTVNLADKPTMSTLRPPTRSRVVAYLSFLRAVAKTLPNDYTATIAVGVADKIGFKHDVPIFGFQKSRGSTTVLLPDIDFLQSDFHQGPAVADTLEYEAKLQRAIFVGGTSGGMITADVARDCMLPRLRAARHFHGHRRVEFLLPRIVQCTDDEARQVLERMPFCRHERISWQEQLRRRFIISIDGNGATCSRVAIALRSNSVLLKYASDEILYYFHGLQPWRHYIPIERDKDVEKIMELDAWSPGLLERVAREGRIFAQRYLTKESVTAYMAQLLLLYRDCFVDGTTGAGTSETAFDQMPQPEPIPEDDNRMPRPVSLLAHIQSTGDRSSNAEGWAGEPGSTLALEGFAITDDYVCQQPITCQAILGGDVVETPVAAGSFCGTRSKSLPLHGFVLSAETGAQILPDLRYEGVFQDGTASGQLDLGTPCVSPTGALLVAMRIYLAQE